MLAKRNYLTPIASAFLMSTTLLIPAGVLAEEDKGTNFGGPNAVENQIAADDKQQRPDFKEQLSAEGIQLGLDYSVLAMSASDVLADSDDEAASAMLRFYGSWEVVNPGQNDSGALVWKVEHRHSYTDTAVKDLALGAGALSLAGPPYSDQKTRLTNLYWRQRLMGGQGDRCSGFSRCN